MKRFVINRMTKHRKRQKENTINIQSRITLILQLILCFLLLRLPLK